jgi:hypothetical protein
MAADARRQRTVASLLAAILLALGAAAGVAADRLVLDRRRPGGGRGPPPPAEILERLRDDLDLTDAQASAILPILEERRDEMASLFARLDPEAEGIRRRADDRVRALLAPEQRARFDARVAEGERRRAEVRIRLEHRRR